MLCKDIRVDELLCQEIDELTVHLGYGGVRYGDSSQRNSKAVYRDPSLFSDSRLVAFTGTSKSNIAGARRHQIPIY